MGRQSAFWVLLVMLFTACSTGSSDGKPADSLPKGKLSLINVSLYRNDSIKAQPELILVESDPGKLTEAEPWTGSGESKALPPTGSIDRIYTLQFAYPTEASTDYVYYFLIMDDQNHYYLKQVNPPQITDLDSFDAGDKDSLLEKAGLEGWLAISPPGFFH